MSQSVSWSQKSSHWYRPTISPEHGVYVMLERIIPDRSGSSTKVDLGNNSYIAVWFLWFSGSRIHWFGRLSSVRLGNLVCFYGQAFMVW